MENSDYLASRQQARCRIYALIAAAFSYPEVEFYQRLSTQQFLSELESNLKALHYGGQIQLGDWAIPSLEELQEEYIRLFSAGSPCPAYQTEYASPHIFSKTQTLADISGFYQAFGLEVGSKQRERVDFIGTELEFMSYLCFKAAYALTNGSKDNFEIVLDAQKKFFRQHLAPWGSLYSRQMAEQASLLLYNALGNLLSSYLQFEAEFLEIRLEELSNLSAAHVSEPPLSETDCSSCF